MIVDGEVRQNVLTGLVSQMKDEKDKKQTLERFV